uniref:Fucosyltransferase n=1 Tax=Eutreptiella gymnastica TaxID=73025 RepID=A0A7S4LH80_9EUGL
MASAEEEPLPQGQVDKIARYKFHLIIEDALCEDHVGPQLYMAFQAGVVPVYLGAPNVRDYEPVADLISIIDASEFSTPRALADHLLRVAEDDAEYSKYLEYRDHMVSVVPQKALTHDTTRSSSIECYACQVASGTYRSELAPVVTEQCYGHWEQYLQQKSAGAEGGEGRVT